MRRLLVLFVAIAFPACASEAPVDTSSSGPPTIRSDVVEAHAEQFDSEVPVRSPGSGEELAAASYVLGHLQQAGYVPLLDSVPVENLVESTNVVALPVSGEEPTELVAVSLGTSEAETGGEQIGVFLEVARALNVARPDHAVAFVALGAEDSPRLGGSLGTRRLLQYLADREFNPHVITLGRGPSLTAEGSRDQEIVEKRVPSAPRDDLYTRSRLEHTVVSGPPIEVGEAVLTYLAD